MAATRAELPSRTMPRVAPSRAAHIFWLFVLRVQAPCLGWVPPPGSSLFPDKRQGQWRQRVGSGSSAGTAWRGPGCCRAGLPRARSQPSRSGALALLGQEAASLAVSPPGPAPDAVVLALLPSLLRGKSSQGCPRRLLGLAALHFKVLQ